jgi:hypothetical protein
VNIAGINGLAGYMVDGAFVVDFLVFHVHFFQALFVCGSYLCTTKIIISNYLKTVTQKICGK